MIDAQAKTETWNKMYPPGTLVSFFGPGRTITKKTTSPAAVVRGHPMVNVESVGIMPLDRLTPEAGSLKEKEQVRIYLASSWRNEQQPGIIRLLRERGYEVYDFRDPEDNGGTGFQWTDIDPYWQRWTPSECKRGLQHEIAKSGFLRDKNALDWANVGVLLLPCGRSAHLEAGYLVGQGKPCFILFWEPQEPELMYKLGTVVLSIEDLLNQLRAVRPDAETTRDKGTKPGGSFRRSQRRRWS